MPPEILVDRSPGDLFIVRAAGNTVDETALGSTEHAVAELGVPLVVVLGHERCGAVEAAVSAVQENATVPGAIGEMVAPIIPAVLRVRDEPGDLRDNAVRANVRSVVDRLKVSRAILMDALQQGRLRIAGAR